MLVGGWGLLWGIVWYETGLRAGTAVTRACGPVVWELGGESCPATRFRKTG